MSDKAKKLPESLLKNRGESIQQLLGAAEQSFNQIIAILREHVLEAASATNISTGQGLTLRLGDGVLDIDQVRIAPTDCLAASDYEPVFDVIAYTAIAARKPRDGYGYGGRAHSLWFCDAHEEGAYRWYEFAFMIRPDIPQTSTFDPFALAPTDEHAGRAFTAVTGVRQIAWQPLPLDQSEEEQFIERWLAWFAEAADGSLRHP